MTCRRAIQPANRAAYWAVTLRRAASTAHRAAFNADPSREKAAITCNALRLYLTEIKMAPGEINRRVDKMWCDLIEICEYVDKQVSNG